MKVAELGSFTAAAELLELPKSTVSRRIARLERTLGQTLLNRDSDGTKLTPAGQEARIQGTRVLAEIACLLREGPKPPTILRVVVVPEISYLPGFIKLLETYKKERPDVVCTIISSTRRYDLVQDPVDLVFRLHLSPIRGPSSLKTKTLGRIQGGVFASPSWAQANPINRPEDLGEVGVLTLSGGTLRTQWVLEHETKGRVQIPIQAGHFGSELPWLCAAAEGGLGPAILPPHVAEASLRAGRLVRLLPQWQTPTVRLSLLWLSVGSESETLRAFIDRTPSLDALIAG